MLGAVCLVEHRTSTSEAFIIFWYSSSMKKGSYSGLDNTKCAESNSLKQASSLS